MSANMAPLRPVVAMIRVEVILTIEPLAVVGDGAQERLVSAFHALHVLSQLLRDLFHFVASAEVGTEELPDFGVLVVAAEGRGGLRI